MPTDTSPPLPSREQLDRVFECVPAFRAASGYAEHSGQYLVWGPELSTLHERLYQNGVVLVDFDWTTWTEAEALLDDRDAIATADLRMVCQLFTSLVRAERFSEGVLVEACEKGAVGALLDRLVDLRGPD